MVSYKIILFLTTVMIVVFHVNNVNAYPTTNLTDPYEIFTTAYTTFGLDEDSLLSPKEWCMQHSDSVDSFILNKVKSCKATRDISKKSIFTKAYNKYILDTVEKIIGQANVKIPLEFCTSRRELGPTQEQLKRLSLAGLDAPSLGDFEAHNSHEELKMSHTDPDASSSFKY